MTDKLVATRFDDAVAIIELAAPQKLNAISPVMVDHLRDALSGAAAQARCILLTGQGAGFCSGADLSGRKIEPTADHDAGIRLESHYNPLMRDLRALPVPLVTAVNGAAAGIGAAIALSGDIILASENAYFLQAFGRIGLVPDGGSAFLLAQSAGRARMMEMMLLGERISAQTALDWSMINRVTTQDRLMPDALAIAHRLAAGPSTAMHLMRQLGWAALELDHSRMLDLERDLQRKAGQHPDHQEGIRAFHEKRPPDFAGRGNA